MATGRDSCFQASTGAASRLERPSSGLHARRDPQYPIDLSRTPLPRLAWGKETFSGRVAPGMLCLRILRKLRPSASKFLKPLALNLSKHKQGPTKSLPASSFRRALEKDRLMPRAPQTASLSFCPQWSNSAGSIGFVQRSDIGANRKHASYDPTSAQRR